MKTRKFEVNLKSCAGTFFYSHVVLIFGGLFLFCFIFMMDERKKYCQPGVYVLCFCFSCFIGPCAALMILSKLSGASLLQKSLARAHLSASLSPCILIYRMVGYYFFEVNRTSKVGHIWPLEITFRPHLACMLLVQCWQPFSMLDLPSGEMGWIYLGQFSQVEIALWASFFQGFVLLHWNWGEFSTCLQWGCTKLQSA